MNENLITIVNRHGMVVRSQELTGEAHPDFGQFTKVVIEGSQFRITFLTTVLNEKPVNYFRITKVEDLYKNRTYNASRFFHKFIPLIGSINGDIYIRTVHKQA